MSTRGTSSPLSMLLLMCKAKMDTQKIDFDGPVTLYHFSLLRSIGKGAFGKVNPNYFTSNMSIAKLSNIGSDCTAQAE